MAGNENTIGVEQNTGKDVNVKQHVSYNPKQDWASETAEPTRGQVSVAAESLNVAVDELFKAVGLIEDRVGPILKPAYSEPKDGNKSGPEDVDQRSDIAKEFDKIAALVRSATSSLNKVSNRVDL